MKKPTPKLRTHDNSVVVRSHDNTWMIVSSECRQWTTRTQRMTYEWIDSDGVQHVTAWSKAVRNAMLRGGAEHQRQKALDRAGTNWNKTFLISTDIGLRSIGQAASAGAQGDLMDNERWGRRSCSNSRKQKTGIDRLPLPGQLSSCCGMVKARLLDQLKCGTRGQEKASQVSDYVLISMRETATHDRMFYLLYMYNSFSSQLP
jgi:hypothetical protein